MPQDVQRANAYTAEELAKFLGELDGYLTETLPLGKVEVAHDVLAAVRAAVVEYGLAARYVGNDVGKRGGRTSRGSGYHSRTVLDRNRAALREDGDR